jgi:hypothetical protein
MFFFRDIDRWWHPPDGLILCNNSTSSCLLL